MHNFVTIQITSPTCENCPERKIAYTVVRAMNHGTMMAHDDDINLNLAVVSKDLHVKKNVTRFSFGVNDVQELR